ncbi:LysM peptidoglycan-binding domain-containing protein [Tenacibaculum sp. MEBiC06402]|uniref:LysM peptidoglycan-binding domain-containing protein n=1 Tax=unclassified Tenacibaculum TaxID=2635139 RepID=UPI003B98FED9
MSKIKFWAITCVLAILVSCSQQKRYISYKVQQGETMRDIAEKINVKTEDLERLNPDVGENPTANSTIIIPNPEFKKTLPIIQKTDKDKEVKTDTDTGTDTDIETPETDIDEVKDAPDSTQIVRTVYSYKFHTVQPGETVYRLTKTYNISKDELIKLNPEFPKIKDNLLSVGQKLKVKVAEKKVVYISREEDLKNHVTHTVQPKETVYSLTRFYNISKQQLIDLNPEFPEIENNALSIGQVLRIRPIEEKLTSDSFKIYTDTIAISEPIKLAFLLPFKAKELDSLPEEDIFDEIKSNRSARVANMVTDFYLGAEMALDSITSMGIQVDVAVFDTGNRGSYVEQLIEEDKLGDRDAIIGPFYSDQVEKVADEAKNAVVFPHFSNNQDKFSSSNIVKSAPDKETHSAFLVEYLNEIYNGETIFIVSDGKKESDEQLEFIEKLFKKNDSITQIYTLKPEDGYIKKERFTDKMKPNVHNWVILTSDKESYLADAINSMVVLPEDVTAQVFSIDKTDAYEGIDNNILARIDFTFVTDNYYDDNDENLKSFVKKYKKRNRANPSEYAIRGFDLTYDVLIRLASGEDLTDTYKEGVSMRLVNKFDFKKKFLGTTNNRGLFIVKYTKDLFLERLK